MHVLKFRIEKKKLRHLKWKHLLVSVQCGNNVIVCRHRRHSPFLYAVMLLLCNFVCMYVCVHVARKLSENRSTEEKQFKLYIYLKIILYWFLSYCRYSPALILLTKLRYRDNNFDLHCFLLPRHILPFSTFDSTFSLFFSCWSK